MYIILSILILLLMISIHEFGHYIVGKWLKFKINEFSIGFGPKIFSRKNKKTGEIFSIRALPLGGFCAFAGEDAIEPVDDKKEKSDEAVQNVDVFADDTVEEDLPVQSEVVSIEAESDLKLFNDQAPWKRLLVLVAGAGFNFISAIVLSFIFLCFAGSMSTVVVEKKVDQFGNEYNIELQTGDEIIAINGIELNIMNQFSDIIQKVDGDTAVLTVIRNGEKVQVNVVRTDIYVEGEDSYKGFGFVSGAAPAPMNPLKALLYCVPYTLDLSWMILGTLGKLLTGQLALTSLSGPVSTVMFMADATAQNWLNIFLLMPMFAANLAIFNLLPIPALDGCKMLFTIIEWVRGKPINRNVEAYLSFFGLILLLGLCVVIELMHFI